MLDNKGELNRILDDALASYSSAEPLAGLEQRVIYRLRTKQERHRRFSLVQAAWLSSLAALLFIAVSWAPRVQQRGTASRAVTSAAHLDVRGVGAFAVPEAPARFKSHRGIRRRSLCAGKALPKQQQFPMPTPLSVEEKALVAFVWKHPKEAGEAFASLNKPDGPLEIQEIVIKPLQVDSLQEEER